jgi:phosphatidylglycerophosphatase C
MKVGDEATVRQGRGGKQTRPSDDDRPLAAFDFDGTLTVCDSFTAFLIWRTPPTSRLAALAPLATAFAAYLGHRDRGRLKAAAIRALLGPLRRGELAAEAEAFATACADRLLRPDARAAWARHRDEGFKLVIVTASPEDIVAPFARRLGADALIGTRLKTDREGRLTGELDGPNCRGSEKVRRLQAAFGPDLRLAAAYGDTTGDREMLAAAEVGHMKVFTGRP